VSRWDRAVAVLDRVGHRPSAAPHGAALSGDAIAAAKEVIRSCGARNLIECGPGESTLALAPHVVDSYHAVEHDTSYAGRLERRLEQRPLWRHVVLHDVSLTWRWVGPFFGRTYDLRALPREFDFALIDGPPVRTVGRLLTLPALWPHLSVGAIVLLDDAGRRRHEGRILRAWKAVYGDAVRVRVFDHYVKGLALVQKVSETPSGRWWPALRASIDETMLTMRSRGRRRLSQVFPTL
jgi:predicted O-methyltransferase YrrM